jgi:hypothetical protein
MLRAMHALRLAAAAAVAAAAAATLSLLALPYAAPLLVFRPEPLASADPARWRVEAREVGFAAADGSRLSAWWVPPPGADSPVVLLVHGRSGNIATRADIVRRLAQDGIGLLAFDYRGYGASGGHPSEQAIGEDAVSAYDWLRARGVAAARIAVVGQSLGNAPAARLAASRPVGALVLVSPFTSLAGAAAERWPPLALLPWPRNRFEVAAHLADVRAPVLFAVAGADETVPRAEARRAAAAMPRPPLWIEIEGHRHDGLLRTLVSEGRLQRFVRRAAAVRPAGSPPAPPRSRP